MINARVFDRNNPSRSIQLTTRDKNQIMAAYEKTEDVSRMVQEACEKVLTRHGVEGFRGPYSITKYPGESTMTLDYFIA